MNEDQKRFNEDQKRFREAIVKLDNAEDACKDALANVNAVLEGTNMQDVSAVMTSDGYSLVHDSGSVDVDIVEEHLGD